MIIDEWVNELWISKLKKLYKEKWINDYGMMKIELRIMINEWMNKWVMKKMNK